MKDQATPRPWNIKKKKDEYGDLKYLIYHENTGYIIAEMYEHDDAKLIVKAVNCYDELVGALKDIVHAHGYRMGKSAIDVRIEIAKEILSKAGEL